MRAHRGNETEGRRPRRRWARTGALAVAVGAVALVASSCNGPMEAQQGTIVVKCARADAEGNAIMTYETTFVAGVSLPRWVDAGDSVLLQDATLSGPVHAADWLVLEFQVAWGSPTTAAFLRSPEEDRFDDTMRRTVTGPKHRDFGIRFKRLFIVHPKDGSFVYDDCRPKAGTATTIASADIR